VEEDERRGKGCEFPSCVAFSRVLTRLLQQYHKAVESAKERYSQDKKAYENRSPEEVAAANAAVAEAAAVCVFPVACAFSYL
jgi:hypothetical protein